MKKALLTVLMVVCLSGCSSHYGQIKCKTIKVIENGNRVFDEASKEDFDNVYEYYSEAGDVLYTDYAPVSPYVYLADSARWNEQEFVPLKVYETKESTEYVKYNLSRTVGPIAVLENYYVDLKARTVETECIYSDAALSYPQFREMEGAKEAYECAKKGYYHLNKGDTLYLNETQKGFECHFFKTFGEGAEITYTEFE